MSKASDIGRMTIERAGRASRVARIRIEHLWLSMPFLLLLSAGFLRKLPLLDFWWHLKAGEIIVTTHSIPRVDIFSFTATGRPFILQNWLAEVIYYFIYRIGGFPLLVWWNALLLAAALLPVSAMCVVASRGRKSGLVATFMAATLLVFYGAMRSQVFSFALFALFYYVLWSYRDGRKDWLWVLPPAMVIWVNLHGAFVLGLVLLVVFLAYEAVPLAVCPREHTLQPRAVRRLAMIACVAGLAILVNPEGWGAIASVRSVTADPASRTFVTEWQPPRIDSLDGVLLFHGFFFITLAALLLSRRRRDVLDVALVLAFGAFGLTSIRNGIWFALVAAPVFARHLPTTIITLQPVLRRVGLVRAAPARPPTPPPIRYTLNALIGALMVAVVVLLSPWVYPHWGSKILGGTLWEAKTPVLAMDYIEREQLQGNIFHPQIYGDYLIWRLWPRQRSFIDGRVHLFDYGFARDYLATLSAPQWDDRLARHNIRYLLLSKDAADDQDMLRSAKTAAKWRVIFEDARSVLFERKETPQPTASPPTSLLGERDAIRQPAQPGR